MANANQTAPAADRAEILLKNIAIDPSEPIKTLEQLYDQSIRFGRYFIDWRIGKARSMKNASRWLRKSAIVMLGLSGLAPILAGMEFWNSWKLDRSLLLNIGYITVALAASAVFCDRFWGYSTAWMRFTTTIEALEEMMSKFEIAWNCLAIKAVDKHAAGSFKVADFEPFCELLRNLVHEVHGLDRQETQQWITEFNNSLQEMQKRIKDEQDAIGAERKKGKTGAIQIRLKNFAEFKQAWKMTVGDHPSVDSTGPTAALDHLEAGNYRVVVEATENNKIGQVSFMVTVAADKVAEQEVELRLSAR